MNSETTSRAEAQAPPLIRNAPSKGWVSLGLRELYAYRELLYFLTWRDIKVRYKQTVLGAAWAILQPLLTMLIFSIFFGRLAKMPSDGVPYPLFSLAALVPWTFFAHGLNHATNSLVTGANLIKKIYFPRLAIPISAVLSSLVDFVLAFIVMIGLMIYYKVMPTANLWWLPFFTMLAVITALGVSFWLGAMNVQFRDIRHAIPFLIQFWMFATPIVYPSSLIDNPVIRMVYAVNPMVGVVEGFRWALLDTATQPGPQIAVSTFFALVLFVSGAFYFRRLEKTFADVI
jgi:lipopolysaccharide transport system permease protein